MNDLSDGPFVADELAWRKAEAERYLMLLDEEAEVFCFQTFDDSKTRKDKRLAHTRHGNLEDLWSWLDALNQGGAGVFVTVNAVVPGAARTAANVSRVRALFADFDPPETAAAPDRYPLPPVWQVESSPGKRHVYWSVDGVDLEAFKPLQDRIIRALGSDPNPKDLPRVMRVPGFYHMKDPAAPSMVRLIDADARVPYAVAEIERAFPPTEPKPRATARAPEAARVQVGEPVVDDLRSALASLRADDRDLWVRMGMALKSMGDPGRALWLEWSQTSAKYDPTDAAQTWESFKPEQTDYRSVFKAAQDGGWVNAAKTRARSKKRERREQATAEAVDAEAKTERRRAPLGDWRDDLITKFKEGADITLCRVHNIALILDNADEFKGRIRFNEFSSQLNLDGADIDEVAPIGIKTILERKWINEKVPTTDVLEAMSIVGKRHSFHPIIEYLDPLEWDGYERIERFFVDFCGCPDDPYHRAAAVSLFVSSIARVLNPGCKVDTMVILESIQGMGKTRLWQALYREWAAEVTSSLNDKDFFSGLRGVWCADFGELDQFSKSDTTRIKQILTQTFDHYRPHYGRKHQRFPRQCVFVGGTNQDSWQIDPTGARRFLPIRVQRPIDVETVTVLRDQLWAEALFRFKRGETWWSIPDAEVHQEESYAGDTWETATTRWLKDKYLEPRNLGDDFEVMLHAVLTHAIGLDVGKQTRADQTRAGNVLRRLGWLSRQERREGARVRIYYPSQAWLDANGSR